MLSCCCRGSLTLKSHLCLLTRLHFFPFLEFLPIAPSLQPVALCRESALPSCTVLGTTGEGFLESLWGAESLQSWVVHHPWRPAQLSHTSTSRRMGGLLISSAKLMVGDHSLDSDSSMRVPAQPVQLLSLLPALFLVPAVPQFPFRDLSNTGIASNQGTKVPLNLAVVGSWRSP